MKIGTVTTGSGVVTQINLTYLPSVLHYTAGTQFTALKVVVEGDGVILDLDATGLSIVGTASRVSNDQGNTVLALSDGIVTGKNVTITITNSAAQTPDIFAYSQKRGSRYIRSLTQKVFGLSGIDIKDFAAAFFPGMGATDEMNIEFQNGTIQKFDRTDLEVNASLQSMINGATTDYYYANYQGVVKKINYIPASDDFIYYMRYDNIGNV